jgi:two-component system, OmpR family, phosphate regulon response regulator OmpR
VIEGLRVEIPDHAPHVLVVDDDRRLRDLLARFLCEHGFRVTTAASAAEARALSQSFVFDALVLDVMMPGETGFDYARTIRKTSQVPILMLTARANAADRVTGLEIGADDYLPKPFEPSELAARIAAVLRRRRPAKAADSAPGRRFGPYTLDLRAFCLRDAAGAPVDLSPMEVDLVAAFATNPGRVLSRDELMQLAPPRDDESHDRSIDHRITRLRRKLEADPDHPQLIKTVRGTGYVHMA